MSFTSLRWPIFALLLLMTCWVHAEGNCPPGYYPIGASQGQAGPQGCAPIPGYSQQQRTQPPPPPIWTDRFGAIATDIPNRSGGVSIDQPNWSSAEQAAIADCHSNGGSNCSIEISYRNGCVALVGGKTGHNAKTGPTIEIATQAAMKVCVEADTNCQVTYAACSPAVRIR